jgi:hypothetical protein
MTILKVFTGCAISEGVKIQLSKEDSAGLSQPYRDGAVEIGYEVVKQFGT